MLELGFISCEIALAVLESHLTGCVCAALAISLLGVAVGPTADLQQDPSWCLPQHAAACSAELSCRIVALFMAMLPVVHIPVPLEFLN